ncbi:MAG: hypothetical protein E6J34_11660 [Chloroflexi bacterium]|nr:MAG: hypothetical protein E6J34_11660 [Chloroflexota bacterium]
MQDIQREDKKYTSIQAIIETVLILAGLLALLFLVPHGIYGDGEKRFLALSELLAQRKIPDSEYSMVGPLFSAPLWYLGKRFWTAMAMCSQYNWLIFAIGLGLTYLLLKDRMDRTLLRKFLLILTTASMFCMHVTAYYGEVFSALCVGIGVLALLSRRASCAGWIAIILGVVNTPASLAGLICLVSKQLLNSKRLRYILLIVAAVALIMLEAWIRRGSPFTTGYANDHGFRTVMPYSGLAGFAYPFFFGLISILFSFGKGLFFYAPGLLLPVRKTLLKSQEEENLVLYRAYLLWIFFLAGLVLIYSRWWSWYGGLFWGPRFFLIASIPASFALAVRVHDKKNSSLLLNLFTLLVLNLSFWVGLNGAVYNDVSTAIHVCTDNQYQLEILCHYTPEFSALWFPFVVHPALDQQRALYLIYWILAFAYLLVPLLIHIVKQLAEITKNARYTYFRAWHF